MKKVNFLILIIMTFSGASIAQNVGIGTNSPTNKLHIIALSPLRLEGIQTGASSDSLLTIDNSGIVKKRTASAVFNSAAWTTAGNAGTNYLNNFIGTTDSQRLVFRTNNQASGFIDFDSSKRNTALGNRAIATGSSAYGNSAFGYQALSKVSTGFSNTAMGDSAAFYLTNGSENIAIGSDAGNNLTAGYQNVLVGIESGRSLTIGFQNVALGYRSLATSSAGSGNIAIGYRSLEDNIGAENIAVGLLAMSNNTGGTNNIAIGSQALLNNLTAFNNIGIGSNSLGLVSTGNENLALGVKALDSITTSVNNTAIGHYALGLQVSSNYNTALGYQAGGSIKSGNNNSFLGYGADISSAITSSSNSTAIGSGSVITQSNMIRLGNSSITLIGGSVGFTTISDERVKREIRENVPGLSFIGRLRPVTYYYDPQKMDELQGVAGKYRQYDGQKETIRYSGFLAQEVLSAAKATGYDFSGVSIPNNAQSLYGINYSEMVVPLVKAVQELQQQILELKAQINVLQQR